jgi:DNA polymerase
MAARNSAEEFLPARVNLTSLRRAAATCEGCELYRDATQTVFGEGRRAARVLMIGEMPGDQEDLQGKPFVGPAGRLLDEVLAEAGFHRDDVYITNAVKHFRWTPRGKRRMHKTPGARHVEACKPWLQAEILTVAPELIVCLGATAAQAVLGRDFRVSRQRGTFFETDDATPAMATHHPAAVLRAPSAEDRAEKRAEMAADLSRAARRLG